MIILDPFRRAVLLALAWCLVGLGIDPGPQGAPVPPRPAASAQRAAWVPNQFASRRACEKPPPVQAGPR